MPRRNTPRSLMRAKPPELLAAAAQRRPIAPADTLGFEEPAASRVGTTEDASNVDVPTLPSPPRTYLDEHRNNRVVVPFRKVRCAAAAAWVCIPGLTGCGMATGLDGYPRQVQSVRHRDTQGWTRRDRVETTQRFLGQRLWRPPCCRTRQGRIPTHSPRADAGMLALTSVAGAPLWVLTVRCACQFGGGDFTVEMWVNCKVVNAQNCRLFEFGSEPLVGATFQDDGELVRRATWRSKGGSDDSQRHACVCVSASVYVCVCVCVCVCLCVAGWLAGWLDQDHASVSMEEWAGTNGDPPRAAAPTSTAPSGGDSAQLGSNDGTSGDADDVGSADGSTTGSVAAVESVRSGRRASLSSTKGKLPQLKLGGDVNGPASLPRTPKSPSKQLRMRMPAQAGDFIVGDEGRDGTCTLRLEGRSGKVSWAVREEGEWHNITTTSPLAQGRWVHVAVTGNATTGVAEIYFDGCLEASGSLPIPTRMVRLRHFVGLSTWYVAFGWLCPHMYTASRVDCVCVCGGHLCVQGPSSIAPVWHGIRHSHMAQRAQSPTAACYTCRRCGV